MNPAPEPRSITRRELLKRAALAACAGPLALSSASHGDEAPADASLTVRTRERRQRIDNFGASDCWSMDPIGKEWGREAKEQVADLLFSTRRGIGLSLWRFNVGAGGMLPGKGRLWDPWRGADCFKYTAQEPYDWSRQSGQQWFLRAARDRGVEQFLAFAISPPIWLTRNGLAHPDPAVGSCNLKPDAEGAFATFLVDIARHFTRRGIPITSLSPLNEPNWDWNGGGQEGSRFSSADIRRVVLALQSELKRQKQRSDLILPESGELSALLDDDLYREWAHTQSFRDHYPEGNVRFGPGKYREYIHDLLGDEELREALSGRVAGHAYWADRGADRLVTLRRALRRNLDRYGTGNSYWQTEYCIMEGGRDLGMDSALRVARVIHHDLVDAEATAWHWWLALSPADYKDGLLYTDYKRTKEQNVLPSRILWTLGHYSRFVRPGWHRVTTALQGPNLGQPGQESLLASAYLSPLGTDLAAVLINAGPKPLRVRLSLDRPTRSLTPHLTSPTHALTPQRPTPTSRPIEVPARSVVTLTGVVER
jgi:hypothetical protein